MDPVCVPKPTAHFSTILSREYGKYPEAFVWIIQ